MANCGKVEHPRGPLLQVFLCNRDYSVRSDNSGKVTPNSFGLSHEAKRASPQRTESKNGRQVCKEITEYGALWSQKLP